MEPKTIGDFGGPFNDAVTRTDPETEMESAEGNLLLEATAQMTNTSEKARVKFDTTTAAATVSADNISHRSQWGNGAGQLPAVDKTATGRYTITYATTFTDPLGNIETVAFWNASLPSVRTGDPTDDLYAEVLTVSANVVTLKVESPRGTLADAGDQSGTPITVGVDLYG